MVKGITSKCFSKKSEINLIPKVPVPGGEGVGGAWEKFPNKSCYLIGSLPLFGVIFE